VDDETDADAAEDALTHSLRETRALTLALLGADSVEEAAAERSELWLQDVEGDTLADRVGDCSTEFENVSVVEGGTDAVAPSLRDGEASIDKETPTEEVNVGDALDETVTDMVGGGIADSMEDEL
jgi:hypothetical protein